MLLFEFSQALNINPCPRTIVYNTCELMYVSGDILNANENVEEKYGYGFTGSFFKKYHIIINDNTKMQLMRMQITPKSE